MVLVWSGLSRATAVIRCRFRPIPFLTGGTADWEALRMSFDHNHVTYPDWLMAVGHSADVADASGEF